MDIMVSPRTMLLMHATSYMDASLLHIAVLLSTLGLFWVWMLIDTMFARDTYEINDDWLIYWQLIDCMLSLVSISYEDRIEL